MSPTSTAMAMWANGMSSFLTLISEPVNRQGLRVGREEEEQGRFVNCFSAILTNSLWFTPAKKKEIKTQTIMLHVQHVRINSIARACTMYMYSTNQ